MTVIVFSRGVGVFRPDGRHQKGGMVRLVAMAMAAVGLTGCSSPFRCGRAVVVSGLRAEDAELLMPKVQEMVSRGFLDEVEAGNVYHLVSRGRRPARAAGVKVFCVMASRLLCSSEAGGDAGPGDIESELAGRFVGRLAVAFPDLWTSRPVATHSALRAAGLARAKLVRVGRLSRSDMSRLDAGFRRGLRLMIPRGNAELLAGEFERFLIDVGAGRSLPDAWEDSEIRSFGVRLGSLVRA